MIPAPLRNPIKTKKKINRPEQDLQIVCVRWFRYQYPHEILIHVPNGGKRTKAEAGIFKAMGVLSGFPDLALFKKKGDYGALFIEMKSAKGSTFEEQDKVILNLKTLGYKVEIVNSLEMFIKVVNEYLRKEF